MVAIATLADETRTMRERQGGLYTEDFGFDRAHSERLGAVGGTAVNWAAEKFVRALPDAPTGNLIGETLNGFKFGLVTRFNTKKHTNGLKAFENPIPGLRKIFQNGWSMYHLSNGITTIGAAYTVSKGGTEQPLSLQSPGSPPLEIGKKGLDRYANGESIRANVVNELMDFELARSKVVDLNHFPPKYMQAELWFIGRKGKRTPTGTTDNDGNPIFKYERPSKKEYLKFFARMDFMYTAIDTTIGTVERALPAGAAKQHFYEREVDSVIRSTIRHYGNMREDGNENPFKSLYN